MNKPNHLPATVPASGGALSTTPGTQRIATRMADDLLNVARSRERALRDQRRYRVGKYEFREADHEQIQRWARMLGIGAEDVVAKLGAMQIKSHWFISETDIGFHVQDGSIISLAWDFDVFPLTDWAWVGGLNIVRMGIHRPNNGRLPALPRCLRELNCNECELTELDLTPVPGLTKLHCRDNQLTVLNLTAVPGLTKLHCSDNQLTVLSLTAVPGLTELHCNGNQLTVLNLNAVPGLTDLDCGLNQISVLNLTAVPGLTGLYCGFNQISVLNLTAVPGLTVLCCSENQLTVLNLTAVPGLTVLYCDNNQLTVLDLTAVPGLTGLYCGGNQLTVLTKLIGKYIHKSSQSS